MHVPFFPLYKNKPKCPFYECCHVMLVILLVASICAVLTGWWSNSVLARATACVSLRIDQKKKRKKKNPLKRVANHNGFLRIEEEPERCSSSSVWPVSPCSVNRATRRHHRLDWEVLIGFRRVLMLSIFIYSQCLCIYLHLDSSQNKCTRKVTTVIYRRGRP